MVTLSSCLAAAVVASAATDGDAWTSVVCEDTGRKGNPVVPIFGVDGFASCTLHDGIVSGATAAAQYLPTVNATGWDEYRSYVLDRKGESLCICGRGKLVGRRPWAVAWRGVMQTRARWLLSRSPVWAAHRRTYPVARPCDAVHGVCVITSDPTVGLLRRGLSRGLPDRGEHL